jgi:hypothetical protein
MAGRRKRNKPEEGESVYKKGSNTETEEQERNKKKLKIMSR